MADIVKIIRDVRDLSQDKFPTSLLYLRKISKPEWTVEVAGGKLIVTDTSALPTPTTVEEFDFATYTTLDSLFTALITSANGYSVATSHAFRPAFLTSSILPQAAKSMSEIFSVTQRYLLDDTTLKESLMYDYFLRYHLADNARILDSTLFDTLITDMEKPVDRHMTLFVAYYYVEYRRLLELAARNIDVAFTNDTTAFTGVYTGMGAPNGVVNVNVADVFNVTEYRGIQPGNQRIDLVGADNLFGDENSYWYRLGLHIREQFERLFKDFSLRNSQVLESYMSVEKITDYYAHFDTYPFTNGLSPFTRAVPLGSH